MIKKSIFLAVFVTVSGALFSQKCYETVEKECEPDAKSGYLVSGQSKNGTFAPADTAEVELTFYANMDYRLSFCSPDPSINGKVQFQIIEYKTVPEYIEIVTYEEVYANDYGYEDGYAEDDYGYEDDYYDDYGYEEEVEEAEPAPEPEKVPIVTRKRVYKKVPKVIYDNTKEEEGMSQQFYYISRERKNVVVKVFIPADETKNNSAGRGRTVAYACVGLLLEHQPAPKLGFK